jgi:hypothetical protein
MFQYMVHVYLLTRKGHLVSAKQAEHAKQSRQANDVIDCLGWQAASGEKVKSFGLF